MEEKIELTPEQEKSLIEFWHLDPNNPPGLKALTKHVFPDGNYDGRSAQGIAVKRCLAAMNLKAEPAGTPENKVGKIELTEEQKQFIISNSATMGALELAREVFHDMSLTILDAQSRVVTAYRKTLPTTVIYNQAGDDEIPEGNYIPPSTLDKVLKRVNKYTNITLSKDDLTSQQKKNLEKLITYLHVYRFIRQMNTYDESDRTLCEDAFIRSTFDKADLKQEEVDQYIEYANQVVQGFKALRRKELLESSLEDNTIANKENPEEQRKSRMDLVEAIGKASTEYNQCIKRQGDLLDDLKQKRSVRLSKEIAENASISTFVQLWRFEEERAKLIKLAEYEQQIIANEVERLTSVEELKARILGLDKDGILHG